MGKPPLQKQELGAGGAKGKFGPQVKGSAKVTFSLPVNTRVPGAKRNSRTTPRSKSAEVQAGTRNLLRKLSEQVSGSGRKDRAALSVSLVAGTGQVGAGGAKTTSGANMARTVPPPAGISRSVPKTAGEGESGPQVRDKPTPGQASRSGGGGGTESLAGKPGGRGKPGHALQGEKTPDHKEGKRGE